MKAKMRFAIILALLGTAFGMYLIIYDPEDIIVEPQIKTIKAKDTIKVK